MSNTNIAVEGRKLTVVEDSGQEPALYEPVITSFKGREIDLREQNTDNDLEMFASVYLSNHMESGMPKFHREIYGLTGERRLVIAAPRKFGKSTILSFFYPLQMAVTGGEKDIMLISRTGSLSEEWLRKIKNELQNNGDLRADYGKLTNLSGKWTEDHIILSNGVQIRAKGVGFQIRGFHPSVVVIDDMEDDESVRSEAQTEALREWFYRALMNTLEMKDQVIIIGTILSDVAFLNELLAKTTWTTRTYSCWDDNHTTSIWPDKWPVSALEARKIEIGSYRFAAEYENSPISKSGRRIQNDWFRFYNNPGTPDVFDKGSEKYVGSHNTYMTIDPSVPDEQGRAKKENRDNHGIIVCSFTRDFKIYVRFARRFRGTDVELSDEIFRQFLVFRPMKVGIETYAFQLILKTFLEKEMRQKNVWLPIVELPKDTHTSKDMRIESLCPRFERGEIFMLRTMTDLQDEALRWPGGKLKDLIDALAYQPMLANIPVDRKAGNMVGNVARRSNSSTGY